jgi:hypothetical protein
MRHDAQLDLRRVGRQDDAARRRDECLPDTPAFSGADRMTLPGGATNASRIRRPSAVRIGMFCRLGSFDASRPVTATACA